MKHRLLTLVLALLLCMPCTAAMAEQLPWEMTSLNGHELKRSLVRAYGDGYEYFTYEPAAFDTTGRMGGIELDLDNDGEDEYLSVILESDQTVTLNVHDRYEGEEWIHTAAAELYTATLTCNIQASDVFLKHNGYNWVIFSEHWMQENGMADGAAWNLKAYAYDGTGLVALTDLYLDGTDIYGTLDDWRNDESLAEYRPELPDIAAQVDSYGFLIDELYWASPICEQDQSLTVVCRMMSVQDVSYQDIMRFTGANGDSLAGFRSLIVDCADNGYALPLEAYLSSNRPAEDTEPDSEPDSEPDYSDYDVESEFIIPDSDVRELTAEELSAYDKETLALIRNEILARYGYPFQKEMYREYFSEKSWYTRNEDFTYGMLTSLEMENIELIKKLEAK